MTKRLAFFLAFLLLASTQDLAFQTNATSSTGDDSLLGPLITAENWHIVQGAAIDIAVGAEGSVWIIGRNYNEDGYGIYKWIPSSKSWKAMPGSALSIAVDPRGHGWVVSKQSGIFRWTIDGWEQLPSTAYAVGIGADGSVWSLGSVKGSAKGYSIYRFNEISNGWDKISGSAVRISVDPNGNAWTVDGNKDIWRWDGSKWGQLPDHATDISVGADGSAYIVSTTKVYGGYEIKKWYEDESQWISMKIGGVRVAADPNGNPYIINEYGQIIQYRPADLQPCDYNTWELIPGSATSIGIGLDNSLWAVGSASENQVNQILRWSPSSMAWRTFPGVATWLSVDPVGNAWTIDTSNEIYRWQGIRWEKMPGTATRISIGADGSVWSLGTLQTSGGYEVFRWLPMKERWEQVAGGMVKIAVDPRGNAWAINDQDEIYMWNGQDWEQLDGTATDIGIGGNGSLYVISTVADMGGFQIWKWDETNQDWVILPGAAAVQVVADKNGNPYIVNEYSQILRPKC